MNSNDGMSMRRTMAKTPWITGDENAMLLKSDQRGVAGNGNWRRRMESAPGEPGIRLLPVGRVFGKCGNMRLPVFTLSPCGNAVREFKASITGLYTNWRS
jgi:hypothetical protein